MQVSIAVFRALSKNFLGKDGLASPRKNWPVGLWSAVPSHRLRTARTIFSDPFLNESFMHEHISVDEDPPSVGETSAPVYRTPTHIPVTNAVEIDAISRLHFFQAPVSGACMMHTWDQINDLVPVFSQPLFCSNIKETGFFLLQIVIAGIFGQPIKTVKTFF